MERYEADPIERKWQAVWERERAFSVPNPSDPASADREPKLYVLEMLPYPTGTLHMGHVLVYTIGDVLARFRRRNSWTVMHPIGFDSFGLPAENAAIREGGHPREIVERNIAHITSEMKRMGWGHDWDRVIAAHTPEYYRWTQWLFLRLFDADLAYRKAAPVKWCPNDQVVLANEQVRDGHCEYCGAEVVAKNLEQWFFRTTAYADELLDDLASIDWPDRVKAMQRNWIGRSEGAEILFKVDELDVDISVFTTRPDTLFGATFFVLAPEHPLVEQLVERSPNAEELREYVRKAVAKRGEERAAAEEKTGVDTGFTVTNPVNGEHIPIWVADYVLMDYGTGAIMAVPAHDERDFAFARAYDLPIRPVVHPPDGAADSAPYAGKEGTLIDCDGFSGLPAEAGGREIVSRLEEEHRGRPAVSYRLRDWGFSRQRYWGCPIPIVYCDDCGEVAVPDEELPVELPDVEDFRPKGIAPLAAAEDWVRTPCPRCGKPGRREVETMDTFVDSSWYFLRYCDPRNEAAPFDRRIVDWWCPVDQYIGGVDHAVMHLIYARFFVKALSDLDLVGFREPFKRLFTNGWVQLGGAKMSKSRGNVIGPDELVEQYGADPIRLYVLFIGPADEDMEWTEEGIEGSVRFLRRLYRLVSQVAESAPVGEPGDGELVRKTHRTIAKVTDDISRRQSFNTAIAAVMELVNELAHASSGPAARFAAETAVSLIQPYAPHVAEELWEKLGRERLWTEPWPEADPAMLVSDTFELVVQVNGRVRDRVEVAVGLSEEELVERARELPRVRAYVDGKQIRNAVVVPGKLVNLVV
ncbi:MAG: leucine--tRNA ligase [Actinobacteria bacterium]|nr:MAG: leucine--tRNA ligase [Actinomycetota bacterium]